MAPMRRHDILVEDFDPNRDDSYDWIQDYDKTQQVADGVMARRNNSYTIMWERKLNAGFRALWDRLAAIKCLAENNLQCDHYLMTCHEKNLKPASNCVGKHKVCPRCPIVCKKCAQRL